jgi:hypothetical protein
MRHCCIVFHSPHTLFCNLRTLWGEVGAAAKNIADIETICKKAEAAGVTVQKFLVAVNTGLEANNLLFDADMAKLATDAVATNLMDLMETLKSVDGPGVAEQRDKLEEVIGRCKVLENTVVAEPYSPYILFGGWLSQLSAQCADDAADEIALNKDTEGFPGELP